MLLSEILLELYETRPLRDELRSRLMEIMTEWMDEYKHAVSKAAKSLRDSQTRNFKKHFGSFDTKNYAKIEKMYKNYKEKQKDAIFDWSVQRLCNYIDRAIEPPIRKLSQKEMPIQINFVSRNTSTRASMTGSTMTLHIKWDDWKDVLEGNKSLEEEINALVSNIVHEMVHYNQIVINNKHDNEIFDRGLASSRKNNRKFKKSIEQAKKVGGYLTLKDVAYFTSNHEIEAYAASIATDVVDKAKEMGITPRDFLKNHMMKFKEFRNFKFVSQAHPKVMKKLLKKIVQYVDHYNFAPTDNLSESIGAQPKYLYHATKQSNVDSIMQNGLQTKYYGAVHGSMDIHPPLPAIYLSRKPASDNLNSNMWTEPVVVLKIDFAQLDTDQMWPDDFIYNAFANEEILTTPNSVMKALSVDKATAVDIFEQLTNASDEQLPELLKPFWFWYLTHSNGGEVAYTADIPPNAIVGQIPHPFNSRPSLSENYDEDDVRYKNDGVFHDPDNKVIRDKGAWGSSHGNSFAITGKSASIIGADGYKDTADSSTVKSLAIKKLIAIINSPGSKEPLYHGFQNRKNIKWKIGSVLTIPLTATSGDLQGSAGYGTRIDPKDNEGPPTVFEFPKGTKICGYSKWAKEDAEDFGHLWSEAIVAGKFRIINVRQVKYNGTWRDDVFITVVRLEPVEYFNPETGKWMPANAHSKEITEAISSPKLYHGTYVLSAAQIIDTDKIIARTDHYVRDKISDKYITTTTYEPSKANAQPRKEEKIVGVSLTRSIQFANNWRDGEGVIFEFDRTNLHIIKKL